jgi:hypothetical protein
VDPPIPAFTVGDGEIETIFTLVAGGQTPFPVEVSVIVTEPAVRFAEPGVNVVLRFVVEVKAPFPVALQVPVVAKPPMVPDKFMRLLFAQTVAFGPALAVGVF